MPASFDLPDLSSPTCHQLQHYLTLAGWQAGKDAAFSHHHLDFPELLTLEYKHLLAQFLAPDLSWMQPETWCLDEDNWRFVLSHLAANALPKPWILKPALLNNGQDIHLFADIAEVFQHYASPKRLGGAHVLQAYIDPPHLLQGPKLGHKYSLRMFVVLTNTAAYLYPQGYFNIALKPYAVEHFKSKIGHITNEHLIPGIYNVIQIPSTQYPIFQRFWPQITHIFQELSRKFIKTLNPRNKQIGFLGMDLMVDANERVWLLELNHGPCFPREENHPLYQVLYQGFWQAVVEELMPRYYLEEVPALHRFIAAEC